MKRIITLALLTLLTLAAFAETQTLVRKSRIAPMTMKVNPDNRFMQAAKGPYTGLNGGSFDKAGHGNGWIYGYNRKVQWNLDPVTGPMVGSIYRQLNAVNPTYYGTIGGMIGSFTGTTMNSLTATLYADSYYWDLPGGRYPNANEFINGYFFAQFNDYENLNSAGLNSWGMYTVADATWGWDWSTWAAPKRLEATEGGATIPSAWTGTADVVYDPATGYYYWTQVFGENGLDGGIDGAINSVHVGRSMTPADLNSWVWSDYQDLRFDGLDDTVGITAINEFHVAYAKDTNGNGTGYGVCMAIANDVDDVIDQDSIVYVQNPKLSWMYTTNWGGDDSTGDWKPNWKYPAPDMLYQLEMKDIFDWYNETLTTWDSIGVDSLGQAIYDTTEVLYMDDPFITWNITNIATENNNVHVVFKAFPGTSAGGGGFLYGFTDAGFRSGYYHLTGKITDSGIVWRGKAKYMGSIVDMDKGFDVIEWTASNRNWMSIGYAGTTDEGGEVLYAQWIEKPTSRAVANPYGTESIWLDDAFMTTSSDGGWSWDYDKEVNIESGDPTYPIWTLRYVHNVTKTSSLHEMGFAVANHGTFDDSTNPVTIQTYGAHQYADFDNPTEPVADLNDFNQFLHVWKITGPSIVGIETEEVVIGDGFELLQNYPNPFNPSTQIRFSLDKDSKVDLMVYNIKGEKVATIYNSKMTKGTHSFDFDGSNLNSGIYFCRLTVNGVSQSRKMILAK